MCEMDREPPVTGLIRADRAPAAWAVSDHPVLYPLAVAAMEARVEAIAKGSAGELVWLLEHPPLYTAGVSAKPADLLAPDRFPVFNAGRGGQFTYHGPGQRVIYLMLDLARRRRDVRAFVTGLEIWIIEALRALGVSGEAHCGRIGVWVSRHGAGRAPREDKIAAIGIKVRRWISFHGVSLNIAPDLEHFDGIVPCGIAEGGVTSLEEIGIRVSMREADQALKASFVRNFGPVEDSPPPQ